MFDLDGTLADTVASIANSVNKSLALVNLPPLPIDVFNHFAGNGADELIKKSLKASGDENLVHFNAVTKSFREIFERECMYKVKPFDGIVPLLQALKEKGIKIAVLSNKIHERTVDVVKKLFDDRYIDYIQGQVDGMPRKPDPRGALNIIEKFHVTSKDCIYVGDTDTDMKTGKNANMFTIGVLWGFREKEELVEHGADAIVEHPTEILRYF
ncbi:MAG TPA: HAD family hydrolase [Candidatus Merdenecus merdavium]|nr:HAD family hydrolase [Candidatus Merdenecus merdavium]